MKREAKISQKENRGCRILLVFVFNILSIMWIIGLVLNLKNTFVQIFVITNSDSIKLMDFEFTTHKKISSGSPRKPHAVYILDGTIRENNKKLSIRCSTISVDQNYLKNLLKTKKAKIWYLNKNGKEFKVLQGKYRTKKDIIKSHLWLLLFFLFVPLFLLIRLISLYGKPSIKAIRQTIHNIRYVEMVVLLFLFFPMVLKAQIVPPDYETYPITLCKEVVHHGSFYVYDPPFLAKGIYDNQSQAVNEYPEQVMQSMMSVDNQVWVDYNTLGGADKSRKKSGRFF